MMVLHDQNIDSGHGLRRGLSGVDLGNFLIKRVAQDIQETLPNVQHYSTLSPIPNFSAWMKRAGVELLKQGQISNVSSHDGALVAQELEKNNHLVRAKECAPRTAAVLGKAAAHYIVHEKLRGKMLCPVGNFHVRNGAEAWRLNVEVKGPWCFLWVVVGGGWWLVVVVVVGGGSWCSCFLTGSFV